MKIFKLPDLGEGLPDAIIRQWYVNVGDTIEKDQLVVAMETAKALVDVVAPFDATVEKLFGDVDATIETGNPLIGFEGAAEIDEKKDTGTVVGKIEQSEKTITNNNFSTTGITTPNAIKTTPAVRALARKLNVDLSTVTSDGDRITIENIKNATKKSTTVHEEHDGWENLSGIKRAMILSMKASHQNVVPITLIDEADLHAWIEKQDITVRIIRAIIQACTTEPALNAHFDDNKLQMKKQAEINLGLAVDMPHGLYVPVIKDVVNLADEEIRNTINRFKQQAETKSLPQTDLHGASIVLSNFGSIAGRFANPIILPPTVAIVGIGRITKQVVLDENNTPEAHRMLPISLTVDHRAITGGEAARFLRAMMDALSKET